MQIELNGIEKSFGPKLVLDGISLSIEQGQFVALLGPSGCGKTTLLHAIAGLTDPDGGRIEVGNQVWFDNGGSVRPEKRSVGMVFQDFALWPHMSVFDNVAFGLKLKKVRTGAMESRVMEVLQMVKMEEHVRSFPHQLSGGQKQRVAIARALAPRPSVLLMDEPLSNLDAKLREQMRWELLRVIREAGITSLFVTHDQSEALSMADTVVLLNGGKVEQQGSPKDLFEHPQTAFCATFVGASNLLTGKVVQISDGLVLLDCAGRNILATSSPGVPERDVMTAAIHPGSIQVGPQPRQGAGSQVHGFITQRAYQGVCWQYQVSVAGWSKSIEMSDTEEHAVGVEVDLWLPARACQTVISAPYDRVCDDSNRRKESVIA